MRIYIFFILYFNTYLKAQTTVNINTSLFTLNVCLNDTAELVPVDLTTYSNYKWYFNAIKPENEITEVKTATNVVAINGISLKVVAPGGRYILSAQNIDRTKCIPKNDTINVVFVQPPNLLITQPTTVCFPNTVNLKNTAITNGTNFQNATLSYWKDAEATIPLDVPENITSSGLYFLKLENTEGCADIKAVNVRINPLPNLTISNQSLALSSGCVDLMNPAIVIGSTLYNSSLTFWSDSLATQPLTAPQKITNIGTYYIKATTLSGCSVIKPIMVF